MLFNGLTQRTLVHGATLDWILSPIKGVDRRMLFRIGEEKVPATSIVRYGPNARSRVMDIRAAKNFLCWRASFRTRAVTSRPGRMSAIPLAPTTLRAARIAARSW